MKVAILMSTYNGEKYLRSQLDSIFSQKTSFDFDLIVRDDGSNDSTINILEDYSKKYNLSYTVGNNIGASYAFVSLLKNCKGYDFYAFSDQDDVWNEDKLQKGIDAIKEFEKPALYCSNCEIVNADLISIGRNTHRKVPTYSLESILCLASCAQGCTTVMNKHFAIIIQNNPIPDCFIMHDSLFTCLCSLINGNIVYDHMPTMKYRMHNDNVFGMVTAKQSLLNVVQHRFKEIFTKKNITMYSQASSILNTFHEYISPENTKICKTIIASEYSLLARLSLVFNKNLKHDTFNKTLTKKLEILFGND